MSKSTRISGASLRHAFKEIIWPRRKLVALGLLLILLNRLAGLVLPASTKYLVDDVIARGDIDLLYLLLALVGGAVTLQAGTSYSLTMLLSVEAQNLIAQLRAQVQRHVLQLPVRLFDDWCDREAGIEAAILDAVHTTGRLPIDRNVTFRWL